MGELPTVPDTLGTDDHTTDPDCDKKFELCATAAAADKIVRYIADAQRWMRQATVACKEEPQ